ncbi:hypothetical protein [Bradyrhizobium cenepequi]|uniref:hypothetical protein n=1 Tax=Bradyrhizobium cenepequi TaxID=2821403 RepID=UPI001CE2B993|nr:hypothetical protein [Bradyrhizobium cenepequi]MCA6109576.1 hypothetical protein [Bradyrhizobium cenepequi]
MLLVCSDLTTDRFCLAEAKMRNRRKQTPAVVLKTKLNSADDPALVASIVDLSDWVPTWWIGCQGLLADDGGHFMTDRREKRQRVLHPGHKALNLIRIVDHEVTSFPKRIG